MYFVHPPFHFTFYRNIRCKLFGYLSDNISGLYIEGHSVRLEILTAVPMMSTVFRDVMSCNLVEV
jgi:hypothetical protein